MDKVYFVLPDILIHNLYWLFSRKNSEPRTPSSSIGTSLGIIFSIAAYPRKKSFKFNTVAVPRFARNWFRVATYNNTELCFVCRPLWIRTAPCYCNTKLLISIVWMDFNFSVSKGPKFSVDLRLKSTRNRVKSMHLRVTTTKRAG